MKKINLKVAVISLIIVLSLSLGALSGCITITPPQTPTSLPTVTTPLPPSPPINPTWTPPEETGAQSPALPSIADVVALVKPSVVAINTQVTVFDFFNRPFTQEGAGSGWVLDKDGLIVTNNHVVEDAKSITVTLDNGQTYTADNKFVFTDRLNDLAVLKINATGLPALKMGDSSRMRVGDWVVAIGNSLGQGIRATEGIVSRQGVSLSVDQNQTLHDLIETSAAINPGNSGGPLVNLAGEVIGITSAKIATIGVEGMGYAISTDTAMPIIQELVNKGYIVRPWLGVNLYTVDQLAVLQYNLKVNKGVLLVQVVTGSPADKTGLKAGDVIVGIGGREVADVQSFTRVLYAAEIGQPLEIVFWRGDTRQTALATPVATPPPA